MLRAKFHEFAGPRARFHGGAIPAQELGFSLNEIRELLSLRMKQGAKSTDIRARAEAKIADIEQKIRALEGMKKALQRLTERCDGCSPLAECP